MSSEARHATAAAPPPSPAARRPLPPRTFCCAPAERILAREAGCGRAFEAFVRAVQLRWRARRRESYLVFGSGGVHGPMILGMQVALEGAWDGGGRAPQPETAERPRGVGGVSVGCLAALACAAGVPPWRLAALMHAFPMPELAARDSFLAGVANPATQTAHADPAAALAADGLLRGASLETAVHAVLVLCGVPEGETRTITLGEFSARTGGTELQVLAVDLRAHAPVVFCSRATPQVPVLDACVASMSVPLLFRPRRVRGLPGGAGAFVDGALVDPYGSLLFRGRRAVVLAKLWDDRPLRAGDGVLAVLRHCVGTVVGASAPAHILRCAAHPLDVVLARAPPSAGSALNLLASPPVAAYLAQGLRAAETWWLTLWLVLRHSAGVVGRAAGARCA